MNTHADKTQENKSQPVAHTVSHKQNGGETTFQFVDNRPEAVAQRKLQEMANNYAAQQQPIQKIMDKSVIQMIPTIKGVENSSIANLVLEYIQHEYGIDLIQAKQVLGKKKLLSLNGDFDSIKDFVDQKLSKEDIDSYFKAREKSVVSTQLGDVTEDRAAKIIGGKVNRGANGLDVEWRLIKRKHLNLIKQKLGETQSNATDQGFFENWDKALQNDSALSKIISTPIDAYSSDTLALAGGLSKFEENTNKLTVTANYRVRQLLEVCRLLEYKPLLVFNAAVSCVQAQAVADSYDVHVAHLDN